MQIFWSQQGRPRPGWAMESHSLRKSLQNRAQGHRHVDKHGGGQAGVVAVLQVVSRADPHTPTHPHFK